MPWQDIFRRKFEDKHLEAARQLHAAWRKEARGEAAKVKIPSLATRLGKLLKHGDTTGWWSRHRVPRRILAELLELDPDAIFGAPSVSRDAIGFPEFPLLPPLEPNEPLCGQGHDGWLLHFVDQALGQPSSKHAWLYAPPGSGKSLVVRYLQLRHSTEVVAVTAATLDSAAVHIHSQLPLVVEIVAATDVGALAPFTERVAPTIVLAPFHLPLPGTLWFGGMGRGQNRAGWSAEDASPRGDWRQQMLDWIDARIERAEYDAEAVAREVPAAGLPGEYGDMLLAAA